MTEVGHSLLAPSAMDRWSRCAGSVNLCKDIPRTSNEASALGTCKHAVSYWCLSHTLPNKTADGMEGQIECADGYSFSVDSEFIEHVNTYLKGVRAARGKNDSAYFELPLDTSPVYGVPDQSGTGDAVILRCERRDLYVGDAKFGYGIVLPRRNRQLLSYAAAALARFDEFGVLFDTVTLAIHQPKVSDLPAEWTVRAPLVRRWAKAAAKRAQRAMRPDAPFVPGEIQCRWCPGRSNCAARLDAVTAEFPIEETVQGHVVPNGPPPNEITDAALAAALDRVDFIEACCRDIRAEALRRAQAGAALPGYKIVEGRRGNRAWESKAVAQVALQAAGVDPFKEPEIVSPAEAERRLKNAGKNYADVAWLVMQPPGAPSLAKIKEAGVPLARLEFGLEEVQ